MSNISRSTRSPGASVRPAMTLVEVLAAASILGIAFVSFLQLLQSARLDLAATRENASAAALATDILSKAEQSWPSPQLSGERGGFSWALACLEAQHSTRLNLIECSVSVRSTTLLAQPLIIHTAFVHPRQALRQP